MINNEVMLRIKVFICLPVATLLYQIKKILCSLVIFFLFLLQEYPLDDLCNEVIDRWKNSRAEVLQQREQVKGSMLYVTIVFEILSEINSPERMLWFVVWAGEGYRNQRVLS